MAFPTPFRATRALALITLLTLPLWFSNCSKSSTDPQPTATSVVGNYKMTAFKVNPAVSGISDLLAFITALAGACYTDMTITFKADGTITQDNPKSCGGSADNLLGSKWSLAGNKMTVTDTDGTKTDYTVTTSSAGMTLSSQTKDDPFTGKPGNITYTLTVEFKKV